MAKAFFEFRDARVDLVSRAIDPGDRRHDRETNQADGDPPTDMTADLQRGWRPVAEQSSGDEAGDRLPGVGPFLRHEERDGEQAKADVEQQKDAHQERIFANCSGTHRRMDGDVLAVFERPVLKGEAAKDEVERANKDGRSE